MDESTVKQHAEAHGNAVVAGDLRTAGADLTPEVASQAQAVMGKLPRPTTGAEVLKVEACWRRRRRGAHPLQGVRLGDDRDLDLGRAGRAADDHRPGDRITTGPLVPDVILGPWKPTSAVLSGRSWSPR